MKKFNEYNGFNLSDINKEVLQQWDKEDVFGRSISERDGAPTYVFYEGPPSANGMPGIHHVMARTIKDIFCRYKTMQGYQVPRRPWASPRRISARRSQLTITTPPAARR